MNAEIVNLRQARKNKARAEREAQAAENRAFHGLTLAERRSQKAERERAEAGHEAHRRETGDGEGSA